jgi:hypothetical protein
LPMFQYPLPKMHHQLRHPSQYQPHRQSQNLPLPDLPELLLQHIQQQERQAPQLAPHLWPALIYHLDFLAGHLRARH